MTDEDPTPEDATADEVAASRTRTGTPSDDGADTWVEYRLPGEEADADDEAEGEGDPLRTARLVFSAVVVGLCCLYVFWVVHPELVFRNSTPTGGDMGAHVWGPAYLRDELLPNLRLTGWTNDWYAGFPAYTFYMVVPSLAIVLLDVGLIPADTVWGLLLSVALLAGAGWLSWQARRIGSRLARFAAWTACLFGPLLLIDVPYNIAFKLIAVTGIVSFPAGVWYLLRQLSLRQPGPELGAVASVAFLMDKSLFHIYGGNIASTMAGEFAFSLSITLTLFALGSFAAGLRTGRYRARTALLASLAMLCHVIPGFFFLTVGAFFLILLRPRVSSLRWAAPVAVSSGAMALWWYLPFYGRSAFLNDMGWEKLGVQLPSQSWARMRLADAVRSVGGTVNDRLSCDLLEPVVNWTQMKRHLLPFAPHDIGGTQFEDPNMWNGKVFFVLAGIGLVMSVVMVVRSGIWLGLVTATAGIAFVVMPQHRFWNARVLPFYYLGVYLLAALGIALLLRAAVLVVRGRWGDPSLALAATATAVVMFVLYVALGMTIGSVGKAVGPDEQIDGKATTKWLYFKSTYQGPVRGWAKWNFEGLESKPGSSEDPNDPSKTIVDDSSSREYFDMIREMSSIGRTNGCGRAYWEYDSLLDKYGTPMAPMLLPYFTDHCIGSMEGLYFEASSTTPFHFLVQSELSQKPSRPERFDCNLGFDESPYSDFDLDAGIKHLQMLGVRYFMALTDATKAAAAQDARLDLVGESGPWQIYEVAGIELVEPLENDPVVWTDVDDGIHSWARPAVDWFNDESQWDVLRASTGPDDWPRAAAGKGARAKPTGGEDVRVTDVRTTNDEISFKVSEVGKPVLIRTSYFPNWVASGAEGVHRVTPNFMVVVPTEKQVTLTYTRTPMELIALLISLCGVAMLLWFVVRPGPAFAGGEFFGDRDLGGGRDDGDEPDVDDGDEPTVVGEGGGDSDPPDEVR